MLMNSDLTKNDDQKTEDCQKWSSLTGVCFKMLFWKSSKKPVRKHLWQGPFLVKFVSDSSCAELFQKDSIASAFM